MACDRNMSNWLSKLNNDSDLCKKQKDGEAIHGAHYITEKMEDLGNATEPIKTVFKK